MPPKKDAFADLFQSANVNKNKPLSELQAKKPQNQNLSNLFNSFNPSPSPAQSQSSQNWDEFDIFKSPSTTTKSNDPFDIFNAPVKQEPPANELKSTASKPTASVSTPAATPAATPPTGSLLDDDFIDAFEDVKPVPPSRGPSGSSQGPSPQAPAPQRPRDNASMLRLSLSQSTSSRTSKRDELVAQLVDIGFPVDVSNSAIDQVGMDLQGCVNFIMSGGVKPPSSSHSSRSPRDDFGAKVNDISADLFSKASSFLNKSKETVIKNFEQFQQNGGRGSPRNNVPAWMQNQAEYKSKASERKPNGEAFEDYGSDEDNIDQDSIARFMAEQKEKEKARNKARIDNLRAMAKDKISGANSSRARSPVKESVPSRPSLNPVNMRQSQLTPQSTSRESPRQSPAPTRQLAPAPAKPVPPKAPEPAVEHDLLGIGVSRAEKFKNGSSNDEVYVSSRRRRTANKPQAARKTTREALDQFLQSDYDTGKEKATSSFTNGDYDEALSNYQKCYNALPATHELRVVINSNLAITLIKLGNYKLATSHCNEGLDLITKDEVSDSDYIINDKPIKFWYSKLLSRKAEALELAESFAESLECYNELVTKLGVNDKKVMDGRRRVNNILHPPPKPKPQVKPVAATTPSSSSNNENLKRVQEQNRKQEDKDNQRYQLQEKVQDKVSNWSSGKEDNLRTLLVSLPDVLPQSLGFPFLTTKKIGLNDLMLPKKVKINYMKVISAIHPDKLTSLKLDVESEMLCQSVFITLNKSWDTFKAQNGLN